MAHHNTVFSQLLKLVPRHEFEGLARRHHRGRRFRKTSRWSQFVAMAMGQLSGRHSLRDVVDNANAQRRHWYHLGAEPVRRSTLARVNEQQSAELYAELFGKLYQRCVGLVPGHGFRFKTPLYSLDASLIDLSLAIFPWSHYALSKGAMKLHMALDHRGHIPAFATLTDAHTGDVAVARTWHFAPGSLVVFDKGYVDYSWFNSLNEQGIYFVTRQKTHARYQVLERRRPPPGSAIDCDQTIALSGAKSCHESLPLLRRIGYRDPQSGKRYVFLTNHFDLPAATIAALYKARWQIELFFKWIKQNLKIRAFLGTSVNAVKTQIWIALCMYLLLAYLKYLAKIGWSMHQMLRVLQLNLFMKRDLMALLKGAPPGPDPHDLQPQLALS